MNINVNFTGIDPTDAIRDYATDKAEGLLNYFEKITSIDIDVGMKSRHHNKGKVFYAEMKLQIPSKPSLYISKEAEDLYKAIDKVRDHLKVELEKIKGKMQQKDREGLRDQKGYEEEED